MRRALAAALFAVSLTACGSEPTAREENLPERASGPDQLATGNATGNAVLPSATADDVGEREGISGATQGPTAGDSDAPYAGDDSRPRSPD